MSPWREIVEISLQADQFVQVRLRGVSKGNALFGPVVAGLDERDDALDPTTPGGLSAGNYGATTPGGMSVGYGVGTPSVGAQNAFARALGSGAVMCVGVDGSDEELFLRANAFKRQLSSFVQATSRSSA